MPRINIEDSIHDDDRFFRLAMALGSREAAIGTMYFAWRLAQKYWMQGKAPIPAGEWEKINHQLYLLDTGLAKKNEDGSVYVSGSEEQFDWLIKKQEYGRLGGRTRKAIAKPKPTHSQPSSSSSSSKKTEDSRETGVSPTPIFGIWNENRGTLAEAKAENANRKRWAQARWKEKPDPEYWIEIVKKVASSSFCLGDNPRGWRADYDFLLKPNTHLKISEGAYETKRSGGGFKKI